MTIAVNLTILPGGLTGTDKEFLESAFSYIVELNTDHHFVFINNIENEWSLTGENVQWIKAGPSGQQLLRWRYWQSVKLPSLLKKIKPSVLFSADCFFIPVPVPQCITGIHPGFLGHGGLLQKKYFNYYKKNIPESLAKSNTIIVTDEDTQSLISTHYCIDKSRVIVAPPVPALVLSERNDERVKQKYTDGKEYFINTSTISKQANLLPLLKAFSLFKKRQQTNMKLVLAGKPGDSYDVFKKDIESYKYRDDVVLTGDLSGAERYKLLAAAYALTDTSLISRFDTGLVTALAAGIPVISGAAAETAPVIRTDAGDITDIAAQMMLLYKDESGRKQLIEEGKKYAAGFSIEKSAASIWQCIQKAAAAK